MSLRDRMTQRQAKSKQAKVMSSDKVGTVSLWEGGGKVEFKGLITFGHYKDPDKVEYNMWLYWVPEEEEKDYVCSGTITIPNENSNRKVGRGKNKTREQKLGRAYLYEDKKEALYIMMFFDTEGRDDSSVYFCNLGEFVSDNSKAPIYTGDMFESQNTKVRAQDKENVKKGSKVLSSPTRKNKQNDWYGPEDMFEILRTYNEDQIGELFYMLVEEWFGDIEGLLKFIEIDSTEEEHDEYKEQNESYNEYEDTERDEEYRYEDEEEENEEEQEEYVDEDITDIPSFNIKRSKRPRIADVANKGMSKSTFKRVKSQFLEGIEDTDPEELL